MATKTKEIETNDDGYTTEGGSLPPLVILEVGGKLQGEITEVDQREQTEGKGKKKSTKTRIFYRVRLSADTEGLNGKTKKPESWRSGELVSLPGSGSLDRTFGSIALKVTGQNPDDEGAEPDLDELKGLLIKVERTPDEVMKKGPWAGKTVKTYTVQWKKAVPA